MKKLLLIFSAVAMLAIPSCTKNEWSAVKPGSENVFFFGFEDWGADTDAGKNVYKNKVAYTLSKKGTVNVPVQFWCKGTRDFDVTTYFWAVPTTVVEGTDFQICDSEGNVLAKDENGAYSIVWKNAEGGVKDFVVKSLSTKTGKVVIQTYNPNGGTKPDATDVESTYQTKTDQYSVRIFSENYMVTVNIK